LAVWKKHAGGEYLIAVSGDNWWSEENRMRARAASSVIAGFDNDVRRFAFRVEQDGRHAK